MYIVANNIITLNKTQNTHMQIMNISRFNNKPRLLINMHDITNNQKAKVLSGSDA